MERQQHYCVLSLDFQQIRTEDFADASAFSKAFAEVALQAFDIMGYHSEEAFLQPLEELMKKTEERNLKELLFGFKQDVCESRKTDCADD